MGTRGRPIQRSFPQTSGELSLDGLKAEVTVQRDASGIPTITADSSHDLFYAQGFDPPVSAYDIAWAFFQDKRKNAPGNAIGKTCGAP